MPGGFIKCFSVASCLATWPGLRAGPPLTERPSRDPLGPQKYRRCPKAGAVDVLNLASDGLCDPRVALQPLKPQFTHLPNGI